MSTQSELSEPKHSRGRRACNREDPSATRQRYLRRCESVGRNVTVTGPVLVRGRGAVVIGDDVVLDAAQCPIELLATEGGRLEIGAGAHIGPGTSLESEVSVKVGPDAVIGPFAKILDNNWHNTGGDRSGRPQSTPVVVGTGARVGARATLLPGATLGDGSVLEDDSVLSGRVPANVVVAGVPARLARKLGPGEVADAAPWAITPSQVIATSFRYMRDSPPPVSRSMLLWLSTYEQLNRLPLTDRGLRGLARGELGFALMNGRYQLRAAQRAPRAYVHGALEVRNAGRLEIGERCAFAGGHVASRLEVGCGAELRIGPEAIINFGVLVRAQESIRIGSHFLMGSRSTILDRHGDASGPVVIGDHVWLAHGVTVMPGVTLGDGSAVSAGTVVDRDVPPGCLAVGSPLKFRALTAVTN